VALVLAMSLSLPARAESFWLEHGYTKIATCPGGTDVPMKSANIETWLLITAVLECTDLGDSYQLKIRILKVQRNKRMQVSGPEVFHFDWVGLAIYRPEDASGETIDWLYDDAVPIEGEFNKDSEKILNFAGPTFVYSKEAAEKATHFTLYVTFRGRMEQFGLL
jgi:hypothetical protein